MLKKNEHYLYPGTIFANRKPYEVITVLGSCVAICLWDPVLKVGGINHYLLPLWNGEGLASPKYGNIAIDKLIEKMLYLGCKKKNLQAKFFGGASMLRKTNYHFDIGERNIIVANDLLKKEKIPVISSNCGGNQGRKIKFYTETSVVLLKII